VELLPVPPKRKERRKMHEESVCNSVRLGQEIDDENSTSPLQETNRAEEIRILRRFMLVPRTISSAASLLCLWGRGIQAELHLDSGVFFPVNARVGSNNAQIMSCSNIRTTITSSSSKQPLKNSLHNPHLFCALAICLEIDQEAISVSVTQVADRGGTAALATIVTKTTAWVD